FHDVWRASLGFNYALTPRWSVRMGGAYDQSPVTDSNRTVRSPDFDGWFLAAGVGYRLTEGLVVGFGYLPIFFADGTVNQTAQQPGSPTITGKYDDGSGNLVALQAAYNFDHLLDAYDQLTQPTP